MARPTWADTKEEAIRELRSRTDIDSRVERWLREAYQEVAYGYRFYELEDSITFSLSVGASEISFEQVFAVEQSIPNVKHFLSLRDLDSGRKVKKSSFRRIDSLTTSTGVPVEYCRYGASILFNSMPSGTAISYRLRYRKQIDEPDYSGVAIPETPSEWDEVIRLKAVARGFEALFEPDMAAQKLNTANLLITALPIDEFVETEDDTFGITPRMER